jgi:protein-L-isoaspartate(D-aspartate) O-methyltransferase
MDNMKELLMQEIEMMGIKTKGVLDAIRKVPRENFVETKYKKYAYGNYPLPIPGNQTVSQPYTVAFMAELLELEKGQKVLEIGAGSGYNAAVIAYIVDKNGKVLSLEINEDLVEFARKNIKKTGLKNVEVMLSDGSSGYKKEAPYDRIMVTANCPEVPENLVKQLKVGGILVVPVKSVMTKVIKKPDKVCVQEHGGFSFVPLRGKYGFR